MNAKNNPSGRARDNRTNPSDRTGNSRAQNRQGTTDQSGQEPPTRGYQKLATAASGFHFDFRGRVVLDIGSSTGGFTAYALEHGAKKVIAIEKGTDQMMAPLRFDPRVELHEKTNIFDVVLKDRPDVIVADVSFISLTKVLMYAKMNLARQSTDYFVMVKPQFEARPDQLNKGVVKNSRTRRDILKNFELWLKAHNFRIIKKADNELKGRAGNLERFYWLRTAKSQNFR